MKTTYASFNRNDLDPHKKNIRLNNKKLLSKRHPYDNVLSKYKTTQRGC